MRNREPTDLYHQRHLALAILVALLPVAADAQTWTANLSWEHDGADLDGFRVYAGQAPPIFSQVGPAVAPSARTTSIAGLAAGVWYFEMTATNGPLESPRSNTACVALGSGTCPLPPVELPGPVINLVVTATPTPPAPALTITFTPGRTSDRWLFSLPDGVQANFRLVPAGATFDRIIGAPSVPSLGADNNDGIEFNAITVTGAASAEVELDGSDMTGIVGTVNGVSKSFARVGANWAVSFP